MYKEKSIPSTSGVIWRDVKNWSLNLWPFAAIMAPISLYFTPLCCTNIIIFYVYIMQKKKKSLGILGLKKKPGVLSNRYNHNNAGSGSVSRSFTLPHNILYIWEGFCSGLLNFTSLHTEHFSFSLFGRV